MRKKVVVDLALDEKEIEQALGKHEDRINSLEKDMEFVKTEIKTMNEKMTDVKSSVDRMENTFMTQSTMMLQAFNNSSTNYAQIIQTLSNNNTAVATEKSKNFKEIGMKVLTIVTMVVTAVLGYLKLSGN